MSDREIWTATDKNMPQYELELNRIEADGEVFWRFSGRDTSDNYGELLIDISLDQLKLLHVSVGQELFKQLPFFDQLREVQAIVDEANKKVDE